MPQRAERARSWWFERWLEVFEDLDSAPRVRRGIAYARSGRVDTLEVRSGEARAIVLGSRGRYRVGISFRKIRRKTWEDIALEISFRPLMAAELMAGRMPAQAEKIFESAGAPLFPDLSSDLDSECTCPDWAVPCKHIIAVYYVLGEAFDRDPSVLFTLRGAPKKDIIALAGREPRGERAGEHGEDDAVPLPADPAEFWRSALAEAGPAGAPVPEEHPELLQKLGRFPSWGGIEDFDDAMQDAYRAASLAASLALGGDPRSYASRGMPPR